MCVRENFPPVQDLLFWMVQPREKWSPKKAHQKEDKSQSGKAVQCKSLELFSCTTAHGVEQSLPGADGSVPGSAGWPAWVLPSHLTEQKSRQEPSASSTVPAHRAGPAWGGEGTQQGAPVAGGLQPSEVRLMVTKRLVVLTGHELEVQNIKKVHPSWMGSTLTYWLWRENGVPHFQEGYTGSDSSTAGKWLRLRLKTWSHCHLFGSILPLCLHSQKEGHIRKEKTVAQYFLEKDRKNQKLSCLQTQGTPLLTFSWLVTQKQLTFLFLRVSGLVLVMSAPLLLVIKGLCR